MNKCFRGPELVNSKNTENLRKYRANLRAQKGPEIIKAELNKQKLKSMNKLSVEKGPEFVNSKNNENLRK